MKAWICAQHPIKAQSTLQVLEKDLQDLNASKEDFLRALSIVHSRVFIQACESDSGVTLAYYVAPGIDMANHSFSPNAKVE